MDKMHEGYVLDGYYEFTEGLGVFFKDIVGNYLIHRLEIKVDVIDVEFENSMFVKTTLMGLPQVVMHMEAMPPYRGGVSLFWQVKKMCVECDKHAWGHNARRLRNFCAKKTSTQSTCINMLRYTNKQNEPLVKYIFTQKT